MNTKTVKNISKYALYLIPFLPLIFIEGFFYPFIINKTIFFRFLIEVSLSGYLWLWLSDRAQYRPQINVALKLIAALLLINIIAAIFGLDIYRSFFSDFERMEGVLLAIYLTIYIFLLIQFLQTNKDWFNYLKIISIASLLAAIYGIVQKFNLLPVFESGTTRVGGTIGNAAFLAGYMLLAGGLSFYWLQIETQRKWRILAGIIFLLDAYVLFLTATRGALLGFVLGVGIYFLINAWYRRGLMRYISVGLLLAAVLLSTSFFYFRDNLQTSNIESVRRLASISLQDATVKNRLTAWKWGLQSFQNHWLLGVGLENFNYEYNKYFTPDINESWFDRTHNIYLDQLVQNGIFGLILYLAIFIYLFYKLFSIRKYNFTVFSVFIAMLTAYGIHNFFVFDALSTAFLYFFIIAFVSFVANKNNIADDTSSAQHKVTTWQIVLLVAGNCVIFYYFIALPFYINRNIYVGYYYVVADTSRSYQAFKNVENYKFASVQTGSQLNSVYAVLSEQNDTRAVDKQNFLKLTEAELRKSVNDYPLEIRNRLYLAQLLINEATGNDQLNEAKKLLLRAKELSPMRPEIYYLLFNLYIHEDDLTQARGILEELIDKLPWFGEPKILLANAIKSVDAQKAQELFDAGIKQPYKHSTENDKRILEYLLYFKEYEKAIPYYKALIEREPQDYDLRIDLSKLYYLTDQIDKAVEEINFINAHNPEALKGNEDYLLQLQNAAAS